MCSDKINFGKVSFFENAKITKSEKECTIKNVLLSDKYFDKVLEIRNIKDQETKKRLKLDLPCFTPSGVFNERKDSLMKSHSGYICIDIDGKDNPQIKDWTSFAKSMYTLKTTAYAGLSVSGNGAFVITPLMYPQKHLEHFQALKEFYSTMSIKIDNSCGNLSRLRFVSYNDKNEFPFIEDALPFSSYQRSIQVVNNYIPAYTATNQSNLNKLVNKIISNHINITRNYDDWFKLACSLQNVPNGNTIFHQISSMDERYNFKESENQFNSVSNNGKIDERMFFKICKDYGITIK